MLPARHRLEVTKAGRLRLPVIPLGRVVLWRGFLARRCAERAQDAAPPVGLPEVLLLPAFRPALPRALWPDQELAEIKGPEKEGRGQCNQRMRKEPVLDENERDS